jgi:uncharacterized protein YaiE (UPF0345 family)
MFTVNQYFDGKVTSLAFQGDQLPATVGVMAEGDYQFNTSADEVLTILSGELQVQLTAGADWQTVIAGGQFSVPANSQFQLKVLRDTAYLCTYQAVN